MDALEKRALARPGPAYILGVSTHGPHMKTAKIFRHGNSQAVRLPKEFRFSGSEVQIKRVGTGVLLLPSPSSYEQVMTVLERFKAPLERQQPEDQPRNWR